jgi:hypothetical protein
MVNLLLGVLQISNKDYPIPKRISGKEEWQIFD